MSEKDLENFVASLKEQNRLKAENRLRTYEPYLKQLEFHALGATKRERLFMAGNRLGKTVAGSMELAMHLTGEYPDWWAGRRWDRPTRWWASGESGLAVRDVVQAQLLGPPSIVSEQGTGAIPKANILDTSLARGVTDFLDTVVIKHKTGGNSILKFMTYEMGRGKWQGADLDGVWFDEEPPEDVYLEGLTRTNSTGGIVYLTFTPLKGRSKVVDRFYDGEHRDRIITQMTIDDVDHFTPEMKQKVIDSYAPHEREARLMGVPMFGEGRVFPVAEEVIRCEPFEIPRHYFVMGALDFGIGHPFGAVWLAWDKDTDTIYVFDEYRMKDQTIGVLAATLRSKGQFIPFAWPKDGHSRDKGSGKTLASQFKDAGLQMLGTHATFPDGGDSTEAGVKDMLERMQTSRFKVFSTCANWFDEFRSYHRKDGLIVKERDDLLSATRIGVMMKRYSIQADRLGARRRGAGQGGSNPVAKDRDYAIFG